MCEPTPEQGPSDPRIFYRAYNLDDLDPEEKARLDERIRELFINAEVDRGFEAINPDGTAIKVMLGEVSPEAQRIIDAVTAELVDPDAVMLPIDKPD